MITAEKCEMLILNRGDLLQILMDFPEVKNDMLKIIKLRQARNKKSLTQAIREGIKISDMDILMSTKKNMLNRSYFVRYNIIYIYKYIYIYIE